MTAAARIQGPDAGQVSAMLAGRIATLAPELLRGGRRLGAEWRCGDLSGAPGASLGVHLTGAKAGVWSDFASGEAGDALDLVAAVLYRGDRKRAYAWALHWLGLTDAAPAEIERRAAAARAAAAETARRAEREAAEKRRSALGIYLQAEPDLRGTPAEAYLAGRGIVLAQLGRQPRALRFHPRLWCREAQAFLPALVASVWHVERGHVATHRTWLARRRDGAWDKAALAAPRRTLGRPMGGVVPLQRGASGLSLRECPEGEKVAVGEGIETCLSVALAYPELRVAAGVSLPNMAAIVLPASVAEVVLLADNDAENLAARRGLQRAVDALLRAGKRVRVARSPVGKDFNDVITAAGQ